MENLEISFIGIIVENKENIPELNHTLSEYGENIIGRMGIPHQKDKFNIITIVLESSDDVKNNLCERLSKLDGIKVQYTK